ncbi:MAG: hypothetical protein M3N52_11835 [Actinomycetota bacterium]|nr:hypothetical protein [Actinomycetota bacterium]
MDFVPVLVLLATVAKAVDFVRYAKAGDYNGITTQLIAWAAGIAIVALAAHTAWADGIVFGDVALADMNLASQILAGIALGSTASLAHDAVTRPAPAPPLTR